MSYEPILAPIFVFKAFFGMRVITSGEYAVLFDLFISDFLAVGILQGWCEVELSGELFLFSVLCDSFDPLYVAYAGLKPVYNDRKNDFSSEILFKGL